MTDTVQFIEPSVKQPGQDKMRRRKSFWRRFFLGTVLFIIITFTTFCVLAGSFTNACRLLGMGAGLLKNRMCHDPAFGGKKHVNILLIGADVSFDGTGESRTDTIKFISIDLEKSQISMMSIPRDTWVELPNGHNGRINAAYQLGGKVEADRVANAKQAIESLLTDISGEPVHIDHYIRVQTGGFVKIVDALGGIDIDVEKKMDYEDPSQKLFIHLKPGMQHLNGEDAMGYVRFRKDAEGDYGRIRRQDQFIRTLVTQMRDPEKSKRIGTISSFLDMVITDITANDALAVKRIVDKVGIDGIYTSTLPTVPIRKGRAEVVEVQDRTLAAQMVGDLLHGPRPTVVVVNGTEQFGLARDVSDTISKNYSIVGLGTANDQVATTKIFAKESSKQEAQALATQLGLPESVDTQTPPPASKFSKELTPATPPQITVVLGTDYQRPQTATP